jgi:hypothetical protein
MNTQRPCATSTSTPIEKEVVIRTAQYAPSAKRGSAPRTSIIVLVSDADAVSPERLAERVAALDDGHGHVIVACSGRPANLPALQRTVDSVEFLLAPAGTSSEDLRELAMRRAPGDIVRLLDGVPRRAHVAEVDATMVAM